ncbi:MAG: hypothetical protein IJG80_09275 [Selenomonadaceae bacterium]|nr:hypothetical protein [Selenomonadaceae bacterium]
MKGIDVSTFNGQINWCDVKDAGIDFAICRTGYGKSGLDETFVRNVNDAHQHGLICGAYHYSYALTPSDAITEALFCKRIIEEAGVLLELPVFFDMEDADGYKSRHGFSFTRRNVTNICRAFLDTIKPLDCGVYASYSWLTDYIDWQSLGCPIWNAQWANHDSFKGYAWQFTDEMLIGGKKFDGNIIYGG